MVTMRSWRRTVGCPECAGPCRCVCCTLARAAPRPVCDWVAVLQSCGGACSIASQSCVSAQQCEDEYGNFTFVKLSRVAIVTEVHLRNGRTRCSHNQARVWATLT